MSAATDILAELARRGVAARADGETIRLKSTASLDEGLLARLREHKLEILAALSCRPAFRSSTCWHCGGSGQCDCISCGHFESRAAWKAGRCAPCEVREHGRVQ